MKNARNHLQIKRIKKNRTKNAVNISFSFNP